MQGKEERLQVTDMRGLAAAGPGSGALSLFLPPLCVRVRVRIKHVSWLLAPWI